MLFSGQLVNLRAFRDEDIKPSVDFMNDMEIILNLDDDAPMPQSYETQKEWFEEMRKNKKSYKDFFWAIDISRPSTSKILISIWLGSSPASFTCTPPPRMKALGL